MATIALSDLETLRRKVMTGHAGVSVIIALPTATSDATAGVYWVKDPKPGDTANSTANQPGNAKGGNAGELSWKSFSYANLAAAYGE